MAIIFIGLQIETRRSKTQNLTCKPNKYIDLISIFKFLATNYDHELHVLFSMRESKTGEILTRSQRSHRSVM